MSEVVITGCSSGLGLVTALEFARAGDRVFAGVRDLGTASQLRTLVGEQQLAVEIVEIDVTDQASVDACIGRVIDIAGRIDVLVNNAGVALFASVEDTFDEQARQMVDVNFLGPLRVTRAVLPQMRAQGGGRVVMVTSVNGFAGLPFSGVYSGTKFALEGMSEALAAEVAPFGIAVTIVEPAAFHTAIDDKLAAAAARQPSVAFPGVAGVVAEMRRSMASDHPEDVAAAIIGCSRTEPGPLRVQVGEFAEQLYSMRRAMDDQTFFSSLGAMWSDSDG